MTFSGLASSCCAMDVERLGEAAMGAVLKKPAAVVVAVEVVVVVVGVAVVVVVVVVYQVLLNFHCGSSRQENSEIVK